MANLPKPQGVLHKNLFFVNYVKMLCKHNYVNFINCARPPCCENAEIPTSGEIIRNTAPHIETVPAAGGIYAVRRAVKENHNGFRVFVILTMPRFMLPTSFDALRPCGGGRGFFSSAASCPAHPPADRPATRRRSAPDRLRRTAAPSPPPAPPATTARTRTPTPPTPAAAAEPLTSAPPHVRRRCTPPR